MMFSNKIAAFALLAATVVSAAPGGEPPSGGSTSNVFNKVTKKCNVGKLNCCQQVQSAKDASKNQLLGALGVVLPSIDGLVGVNCSPIGVLGGIGGNSCNAQPVCCKDNTFGGLVAVGCTPINANL